MLQLRNLSVHYQTILGDVQAVDGINLDVAKGEALGLAGESGCGKSTSALSIMRLLPYNAKSVDGEIRFNGENLAEMNNEEFRKKIRWKKISMVFQGSMNAFSPVLSVGSQIADAILNAEQISKKEAWERTRDLLHIVGVDPSRASSYPHELSGGMKQRSVIAMALACDPDFLIADEPTTALDVIVSAQILVLLDRIKKKRQLSTILISHDLSTIAEICDKCAIMYGGKIIEYTDIYRLFKDPRHPYTQGLLSSFPSVETQRTRFSGIAGTPPNLINPPPGCRFFDRCKYATNTCREEPEILEVKRGHFVACHYEEIIGKYTGPTSLGRPIMSKSIRLSEKNVLEVVSLKKWFPFKTGIVSSLRRKKKYVRAVDNISFELKPSEAFGLIGESGCGKTTTGRLILRLIEPTGGKVVVDGKDFFSLDEKQLRQMRSFIQMIFQDPYSSLNPRLSVHDLVGEPLRFSRKTTSESEKERIIRDALENVNLKPPESFYYKYPHELSGGQRQRVAIARCLTLDPRILIADEPVSMLDVSIRAEVLNLFQKLQEQQELALIFITHDLAVARHLCDRIAVMYLGEIVELGSTDQVIGNPKHPYTAALIAATPKPDPTTKVEISIKGDISRSIDLQRCCSFYPRCPRAHGRCIEYKPQLIEYGKGHYAACHVAR